MTHIPFSSHYCTIAEALEICVIVNKLAGCQMAFFSIDSFGNCEVQAHVKRSTMRVLAKHAAAKKASHYNPNATTQESPAIG